MTRDRRQKLTDVEIAEIRTRYATGSWTQTGLAETYGVSQAHISLIVRDRTRQHRTRL